MRRLSRIIFVLATSVATMFGVALGGNVLCVASDGHAAVEPPHPDRDHHHHDDGDRGHEDSDGCPDDSGTTGGGCIDLSVDADAVRDLPVRWADVRQADAALPPSLAAVHFDVKAALPLCLPGLGTHPPAPGGLDCLRAIILLV